MGDMYNKQVISTIREHYEQIFSAERKVADFILQNPEKAVNCNVSELANCSGVSDATVIRLSKHIGYSGYYQLRICLSHELGRKQKNAANETTSNVKDIFNYFADEILKIGKQNECIKKCVKMINECKQVHIVAVGNTSHLAQYLGFCLGRLGIKGTYNLLPEYFINQVNLADPEDLVIAISKSGTSKQVVQTLELAREKAIKVIAITGHKYSPVSNLADILLLSGNEGDIFSYNKMYSYSHLAETAVIDALLYFITNEDNIELRDADKPEIIFSEYKI